MVICPIARAVHCTGCVFFKICPAKTILGDYSNDEIKPDQSPASDSQTSKAKSDGESNHGQ